MICWHLLIIKIMNKFYLLLWLKWAFRLTICSLALASIFSLFITIFTYFNQGAISLNTEIFKALIDVFIFWFPITWSISLLIALFRSLKYIFNSCISGYKLKLLECGSVEYIDIIGYGDLVKVWRKWLMLIIWLIGTQMIIALAFTYIFTSYTGIYEWFNIYWLYAFLLTSAYISFILITSRCKRVKVVKC